MLTTVTNKMANMHPGLRGVGHQLLANTLFWSVMLTLLLEDDVAMLACMFS